MKKRVNTIASIYLVCGILLKLVVMLNMYRVLFINLFFFDLLNLKKLTYGYKYYLKMSKQQYRTNNIILVL